MTKPAVAILSPPCLHRGASPPHPWIQGAGVNMWTLESPSISINPPHMTKTVHLDMVGKDTRQHRIDTSS